jgi:hypothetical protein
MSLTDVNLFRIDGTLGSVSNISTASLNGGPLAGFRNRIINGSMDVSQRGVIFPNIDGYCLDRWYVNRAGSVSGLTAGQAYGAFGTKKNWMSLHRDSGDTATASAAIYQPIEGINCRDLAGTTVTISFTLGTGSTLSSTSNNVAIKLFYQTTSADIGASGSWTLISSTSISVASNTGPTRYTASFSVPSTATQLLPVLEIAFAGTAGADDRYYITDFQLEAGPVATPFERRPIGAELALCQRYYETKIHLSTGAKYANTGGSWFAADVQYVSKRATPTITITASALSNCTSPVVGNFNSDCAAISVSTSGAIQYAASSLTVTASAEL